MASAFLVALVLSGAAVVALVKGTSPRRSGGSADDVDVPSALAAPSETPAAGPPGKVKLSLRLPPGSALSTVGYVVQSGTNTVAARGSILVPDPATTSVSQEVTIPSGPNQTVTFLGSVANGGANRTVMLGRQSFDVPANGTAEVSFAAGTGVGGGATSGGGGASDGQSCQACQLASAVPLCDPPNLTATSSQDPRTGEQTGIGWGCQTLGTPAARGACVALLHCLNSNDCEKGGRNPVMGCYCGSADAQKCFLGEGVDGPCIAEYAAAAAASAGGPAAGATASQRSRFIATAAADPTTPVGLADNIRKCAIDTPCEICEAL